MEQRNQFRIVLLILVFIAIILGGFSVYARYFIFTDGTAYAKLGENIATGEGLRLCGGWHVFYPPGYPFAIAGLSLCIS
ncbi:MAG: hypothetical protein P9L94_04385 [Candidatus Hinthialibacter antarcticus]|nr:hypothetical protein [Candidatus Hinthialibacter antarcticus]